MSTINWSNIRHKFPVTEQYAYFQHPAVTALPKKTTRAMSSFLQNMSEHGCRDEKDWRQSIESTRNRAASLLGVEDSRIGFVKNTSHGLSILAESIPFSDGNVVLFPECEFPANQYPWMNQTRNGVQTRTIETTHGSISPEKINNSISNDTRVLTISSVQYKSGFRANLRKIGQMCADRDIYFIVDAIQSLGWDPIKPRELNIDALVADGHKWLCGPEGAGIIYLNKKFQEQLELTNIGWKSVQNPYNFEQIDFALTKRANALEEGSHNTVGLIGLGESLELIQKLGIDRIHQRVLELKDTFVRELKDLNFQFTHEHWEKPLNSSILCFNHPQINSSHALQFCRSNNIQLSERGQSLRAGVHFYNNRSDLQKLVDAFRELI